MVLEKLSRQRDLPPFDPTKDPSSLLRLEDRLSTPPIVFGHTKGEVFERTFGSVTRLELPHEFDQVKGFSLNLELPALEGNKWVNGVGLRCVEEAHLFLGASKVASLTSEDIYLGNLLDLSSQSWKKFREVFFGFHDETDYLDDYELNSSQKKRQFKVHLPFWFRDASENDLLLHLLSEPGSPPGGTLQGARQAPGKRTFQRALLLEVLGWD